MLIISDILKKIDLYSFYIGDSNMIGVTYYLVRENVLSNIILYILYYIIVSFVFVVYQFMNHLPLVALIILIYVIYRANEVRKRQIK